MLPANVMKRIDWKNAGIVASVVCSLASCAQPEGDTAFTVRKIESIPSRREGGVRIKLTTPGNFAEADESLIVQYAQIVAVREATQRQRQVAVTRARASFRKIAASPAAHPRQTRYLAVKTEASAPSPKAEAHPVASAPSLKAETHPVASVILWDTQTQEIVGNKVYDLGREPLVGTVERFETHTAEYVGSGL